MVSIKTMTNDEKTAFLLKKEQSKTISQIETFQTQALSEFMLNGYPEKAKIGFIGNHQTYKKHLKHLWYVDIISKK